jgi:pimeloyl-ACP methyl ester carboxylesterase
MATNSPIVFLHGIQGSHLAQVYDDSFDTIWSAVQKGFESIDDLMLEKTGQVELDKFDEIRTLHVEMFIYRELLGRLRKRFKNVPTYIFRYDWRLDNATAAERLEEYLQYLTKKTRAKKFRFVTHSMGGLVLSAWLARDGGNLGRIDRAAIAAPPFSGAPDAIRALVIGDATGFGINSSDRFRKVGRTFPSLYQLVSSYDGMWDHHDPNADVWDHQYWQRRRLFGGRDKQKYQQRDSVMAAHLARAGEFHRGDLFDFDACTKKELADIMVFYGTGEKTLVKVGVAPRSSDKAIVNVFDFASKGCFSDEGDGTVPVASVMRYSKLKKHEIALADQRKWWAPTTWDDAAQIRIAGYHGAFLALDNVQKVIIAWLAGEKVKSHWSRGISA